MDSILMKPPNSFVWINLLKNSKKQTKYLSTTVTFRQVWFNLLYIENRLKRGEKKCKLEVDQGNFLFYLLKRSVVFWSLSLHYQIKYLFFRNDATLRGHPYRSRETIQSGNDHQTRGYWNNEKKWIKEAKPAHEIGIHLTGKYSIICGISRAL